MAKICLCLTAKTIGRNLEILSKYRQSADLAELRVDCLDSDERLLIRRFPELAGLPVILTIRRDIDGGHFSGGEGARVKLMARGLAFANEDSRHNFAYVDIEDDLVVPSLEEAARTFGTRIIRSCHNLNGIIDDIPAKIKFMQRSVDEIAKVAVSVKSSGDVLRVFRASKACAGQDKILICMGHFGVCSRILAERFGSFLTYASALYENEIPGASGQMDVQELAYLYRFRRITKKTKVYGITGFPLNASISPWFFNNIFCLENSDMVYVPFPADSVPELLELVEELNVQGLSVTVPYKEAILPFLSKSSQMVQSVGACNTLIHTDEGWYGENTDCTGFSDSLLNFLGEKNLKNYKITIIGSGGVARAAAAEIFRLKGKALILNRSVHKARNVASQYKFRWGGLDSAGMEVMSKYSDVIIQASSAGMEGHDKSDPAELFKFTGKEAVMDLIYTPAVTPFLARAAAAGCRTINGYDMVIRQACLQFSHYIGREIPQQFLSRIMAGENIWNRIQTG
ncbi:MAG: type I 3-dehydroquinate dehydratase [Treponema sp.]|jgi:3-dehydroquinate dehydratase/shikimate dehydrogenase|nr:type I 3-dehydroquinate dehydratase [Treponema sp.]